jgi:hypothetical protein
MRQITNKQNLPEAIVRAVSNDSYTKGDSKYSVTQLIGPPRQAALLRRHREEIVEDAADRIWSLLGQVAHGILERADWKNALTEERLYANIDGITISGQLDRLILTPDEVLSDYKVTSVWTLLDGVKPEWERQLNILAELLRLHSFAPSRLQVVAILRDWSKGRARREPNYPQQGVAVLDVPLWSQEKAQAYIRERIRLHEAAEVELPECTSEERWARPDVYAVHKGTNKRASKLCATESEAIEYAASVDPESKTYRVVHRPGASIRCADYCAVSEFCSQYQAMQPPADDAEAA